MNVSGPRMKASIRPSGDSADALHYLLKTGGQIVSYTALRLNLNI